MGALELCNLQAAVGPEVSCTVEAGTCLALRGASGAGKSLLLRAIADLDRHRGDVLLDGVSQSAVDAPAWRRQVLYVATEPGWWCATIGEHFADWHAVVDDLESFGFPPDCADWPVARLSSGERQRLGLIRALSFRPRVLLLDEPTATLDAENTARVEDMVARRREAGMTVLWISHDETQAFRVATAMLRLTKDTAVMEVMH